MWSSTWLYLAIEIELDIHRYLASWNSFQKLLTDYVGLSRITMATPNPVFNLSSSPPSGGTHSGHGTPSTLATFMSPLNNDFLDIGTEIENLDLGSLGWVIYSFHKLGYWSNTVATVASMLPSMNEERWLCRQSTPLELRALLSRIGQWLLHPEILDFRLTHKSSLRSHLVFPLSRPEIRLFSPEILP